MGSDWNFYKFQRNGRVGKGGVANIWANMRMTESTVFITETIRIFLCVYLLPVVL